MRAPVALVGVALFVGHGGQPLDRANPIAQRAPQPAVADASDIDASRFLAAARGADPVICSLAAAPLGERWGYDRPPAATSAAESGLLEWALKPSFNDRDLTVLGGGLRDDDACVRTMAARLLGSGGTAGARILTDALDDERPEIRRVAAEGLGHANEAGVRPLIRRLSDSDPGVRAAAAWALGEIEDPEAAPALAVALSDPVTMVRLAAIEALGRIELEASIESLLPMLGSDDARVRAATARAIGRIL